jgi:hypothetical protein
MKAILLLRLNRNPFSAGAQALLELGMDGLDPQPPQTPGFRSLLSQLQLLPFGLTLDASVSESGGEQESFGH